MTRLDRRQLAELPDEQRGVSAVGQFNTDAARIKIRELFTCFRVFPPAHSCVAKRSIECATLKKGAVAVDNDVRADAGVEITPEIDGTHGRRAAGKVNDQRSPDWHGSPFSGNEFAFCLIQNIVAPDFHVLVIAIGIGYVNQRARFQRA